MLSRGCREDGVDCTGTGSIWGRGTALDLGLVVVVTWLDAFVKTHRTVL